VAQVDTSFREQVLEPGVSLEALPPPRISYTEQRFLAELTLVGAPFFLYVWGVFAFGALTHGAMLPGIPMSVVWVGVAVGVLVMPYGAVLGADGSLTFKAVTRRITTHAEDVYRIGISSGYRGAGGYVFYFDDRRAALGAFGGRVLARYLLEQNPAIDAPKVLKK
jgi:hypothetical protein